MDPATMIPVAGMFTAIFTVGVVAWCVVQVARGPVGQAIGRRLQGRHGADPELAQEVAALRDQVDILQQQLMETQERVDFTERLLSKGRAPESLPRS